MSDTSSSADAPAPGSSTSLPPPAGSPPNPPVPSAPPTGSSSVAPLTDAPVDTVNVRLVHVPGSTFDTGIEGIPTVTTTPTRVPAEHADTIVEKAAAHGLTIIIEEA